MGRLVEDAYYGNAKDTNNNDSKSKEIFKHEEVKDTPFTIITTDKESFGVLGNHRITEFGTKAEIKKELKKVTWNRIVQVLMILNKTTKEI